MDARREAQRISRIFASRATTQTRFLAATRRDGAIWAHFCVARPRHTLGMPSGSRLELRPTRLRRMRESKSDRLPRGWAGGDSDPGRQFRTMAMRDQLGDVPCLDRVVLAQRRDAVGHHDRAVGAGGHDRPRRLRQRLLDPQHVDPLADRFLQPHARAARAAAHRLLAVQRELQRRVLREPAQNGAGSLEFAVVAAEVAGLVVDHALELADRCAAVPRRRAARSAAYGGSPPTGRRTPGIRSSAC